MRDSVSNKRWTAPEATPRLTSCLHITSRQVYTQAPTTCTHMGGTPTHQFTCTNMYTYTQAHKCIIQELLCNLLTLWPWYFWHSSLIWQLKVFFSPNFWDLNPEPQICSNIVYPHPRPTQNISASESTPDSCKQVTEDPECNKSNPAKLSHPSVLDKESNQLYCLLA